MPPAEWSSEAQADLEAIYDYIARQEQRLSVARQVVRRLRDHCDECARAFAEGHQTGTARDDLFQGCRVFNHQRWVIVFRPRKAGIQVLRVLDGGRDFPSLFSDSSD